MRDATPEEPPEADALARFLAAEPGVRVRMAAGVVEAVGRERLERVVAGTLARTGTPVTVEDSPDGLVVGGPRGRVRAWVQLTAGGDGIAGMLLEGAPYEPSRRRPSRSVGLVWPACLLLLVLWDVLTVWTAADRASWCAALATLTAAFVLAEGLGAPAQQPRLVRRAVEAVALAALPSVRRLPGLPSGHADTGLVAALALLAGAAGVVAAARLHHWRSPVSQPLHFPLEGVWYVLQGGGRLLNHHARLPEQRGAVDLTGLGPHGTRTRPDSADLTAYAAYGRPVRSPCHGRVVSTATTIPDQRPGELRYQPPYGNHVFLDTGREIVKLAHLRPGSVTVRPGDVVAPGRLLGEVGNSGNSTEPHLHLHAERDGLGLDLRFTDVRGRLYRGRRIRVAAGPRPR
ncbi:M23 family metallopeptidase [Streptomyces bungoensis]|uniref:M23 family metallopeptidase n=1 Tax=Streptomyces bungoensis TaxID=285568 RepID=UPI0034179AC0